MGHWPHPERGSINPHPSKDSLILSGFLALAHCPFIGPRDQLGLPMNQGFSFGCGPSPAYPPVLLSLPSKSGTREGAKYSLEGKLGG